MAVNDARRRRRSSAAPTRSDLGDIAARRTRADRARARRQAAAGRHHRRDVHDQQPRDVSASTAFTAIIVPPQAGILAVGAMKDRVVPVMGGIAAPADDDAHAVLRSPRLDGARGAAFLHDVVEALVDADKRLV